MNSTSKKNKSISTLQAIAPVRSQHYHSIAELACRSFQNYYQFKATWIPNQLNSSLYDWDTSRIIVENLVPPGERKAVPTVTSHVGVWSIDTHVGSSILKTAGIGMVATCLERRGHGLSAKTMRSALQAAVDAGYDIAILFGIPDFYLQFGFVRAWNYRSAIIAVKDLPVVDPKRKWRKLSSRQQAEIDQCFNQTHQNATGQAVRPVFPKLPVDRYSWNMDTVESYVGVETTTPGRLTCIEYGGDAKAAVLLLQALSVHHHCHEIELVTIPWQSDLFTWARQGSMKLLTSYQKNAGALVTVLNPQNCLQKLTNELNQRLQRFVIGIQRLLIRLSTPRGAVDISLDRGVITCHAPDVDRVPDYWLNAGHSLGQLILGTSSVEELTRINNWKLSPAAIGILSELFPERFPDLAKADQF